MLSRLPYGTRAVEDSICSWKARRLCHGVETASSIAARDITTRVLDDEGRETSCAVNCTVKKAPAQVEDCSTVTLPTDKSAHLLREGVIVFVCTITGPTIVKGSVKHAVGHVDGGGRSPMTYETAEVFSVGDGGRDNAILDGCSWR